MAEKFKPELRMIATDPHRDSPEPMSSANVVLRLIIAWTWVGVPLALGIYATIITSLPLFRS